MVTGVTCATRLAQIHALNGTLMQKPAGLAGLEAAPQGVFEILQAAADQRVRPAELHLSAGSGHVLASLVPLGFHLSDQCLPEQEQDC